MKINILTNDALLGDGIARHAPFFQPIVVKTQHIAQYFNVAASQMAVAQVHILQDSFGFEVIRQCDGAGLVEVVKGQI